MNADNSYLECEENADLASPISKLFALKMNEYKDVEEKGMIKAKGKRINFQNKVHVSGTTLELETERFGKGLTT